MNTSAAARAAVKTITEAPDAQLRARVAEFLSPAADADHKEKLVTLFGWLKGHITDSFQEGLPPVPSSFEPWINKPWIDDSAQLVQRLETPDPLFVGGFFSLQRDSRSAESHLNRWDRGLTPIMEQEPGLLATATWKIQEGDPSVGIAPLNADVVVFDGMDSMMRFVRTPEHVAAMRDSGNDYWGISFVKGMVDPTAPEHAQLRVTHTDYTQPTQAAVPPAGPPAK